MKVLLVLALAQLAFSFELTDPDWVAFKVSNLGLRLLDWSLLFIYEQFLRLQHLM